MLPKTFWATFITYEEAERYGKQLDALLAQGIVPESLLKPAAKPFVSWSVDRRVAEYGRANDVPVSDLKNPGHGEGAAYRCGNVKHELRPGRTVDTPDDAG